jgi:hypothetical protein
VEACSHSRERVTGVFEKCEMAHRLATQRFPDGTPFVANSKGPQERVGNTNAQMPHPILSFMFVTACSKPHSGSSGVLGQSVNRPGEMKEFVQSRIVESSCWSQSFQPICMLGPNALKHHDRLIRKLVKLKIFVGPFRGGRNIQLVILLRWRRWGVCVWKRKLLLARERRSARRWCW